MALCKTIEKSIDTDQIRAKAVPPGVVVSVIAPRRRSR